MHFLDSLFIYFFHIFSVCGLHFYYLSKYNKIYGKLAIFLTPNAEHWLPRGSKGEETAGRGRKKFKEIPPINHASGVWPKTKGKLQEK